MNRGLIIAAPASASGKTTITLGVLRALKRAGQQVRGAKSGPDYIDPRFHEAACAAPCLNLDAWAMSHKRIQQLASGTGLLLIEGAMGLFDGAPPAGKGATADLARILNLPVVLVVDCARMAQSVVPLVAGFANHDPGVQVCGVILNNVGSDRHEAMLRRALDHIGMTVFGAVRRHHDIAHPARHLGLVQASERPDLDRYLDRVADVMAACVDLSAIQNAASPLATCATDPRLAPPAQSIAIARDAAFAFTYPHLLNDWRHSGAHISFFSPLNNEGPEKSDLVILPGGYPELYAAELSSAANFREGMIRAAETARVYGECGGYMVLGDALTDADGKSHPMLGLLRLETSFADRKLHLGYRNLTPLGGPFHSDLKGHEFHYATTIRAHGDALYQATDAEGSHLPDMGLRNGTTCGSFAHVIDQAV